MHITRMSSAIFAASAAAVASIGFASHVAASPNVQFQTVINQGDSIAGDSFGTASQVVAGPNGSVGISAVLQNSSDPIIIYSTPVAGNIYLNTAAAVGGTPYVIPGFTTVPDSFNGFDNLAISPSALGGTTLTFDATDGAPNAGILQWKPLAPTLTDVAFDGDIKGYSSVGGSGTNSGGSILEMQVNASAQALFPAISNATSASSLVRGDSVSLSTIFTSTPALSNALETGTRVAVATDNSAAAVLDSSTSGTGVYSIPANGGTPTLISGSFTPNTTNPLIGYASGSGVNAGLMLVNGATAGTSDVVLEKNNGTPHSILSSPFTIPTNDVFEAQMSPNGKIALYVPSTTGDTIQYANAAAANSSASVIASVAPLVGPAPASAVALDPSGSNLYIEALTELGQNWAPEVNSNGTIVFTADVGTSPTSTKTALLDWQPGDASPEILVADGDTVMVDNQPVTVNDFFLNSLSSESDFYKNALNDQNGLAVVVDYTDASSNPGEAVLYTTVPEPGTLSVLGLASAGLMARRRRS